MLNVGLLDITNCIFLDHLIKISSDISLSTETLLWEHMK